MTAIMLSAMQADLVRHEVLPLLVHRNLQRLEAVLPRPWKLPCGAPGLPASCLQPHASHWTNEMLRTAREVPPRTCKQQLLRALLQATGELLQLRLLRQDLALQQHGPTGAALRDGILPCRSRIPRTHCRFPQLTCRRHPGLLGNAVSM